MRSVGGMLISLPEALSAELVKLEFHGTDTDTVTDSDIFARIVARMSACRPFSLP